MRFILKSGLTLGLLLALSASAQASILTAALNPDGGVSTLQDNSGSVAFDSSGNLLAPTATLAAGDIIVGTLRINNRNDGSLINAPQQLTALFSVQITGPVVTPFGTGAGAPYIFNLQATPTGTGLSINELLNVSGSAFFGTTFAPNTVFALMESPNAATNLTQSLTANISDFKSGMYSLDLTGGLASGTNSSGSTDFFQAKVTNQDATAGITVAELLSQPTGSQVGQDSGAFSVLINNTGLVYGPVAINDQGYATSGAPTAHTSQVTFDARLNVPDTSEQGLGYGFVDDTTIKVNGPNLVPEPASLTLLAIGLGSLGGLALRRRKKPVV